MEQPFTVLVVDDEPTNLQLLNQILGDQYHLKFAASGKAAINSAQKHIPDLILLDILLPDIDGFEVLRQLRSNPVTEIIPVLIITAQNDIRTQKEAQLIGADGHLIKPIDSDRLLKLVAKNIPKKAQKQKDVEARLALLADQEDKRQKKVLEEFLLKSLAKKPIEAIVENPKQEKSALEGKEEVSIKKRKGNIFATQWAKIKKI